MTKQRPRYYRVMLHNDDFNRREYVVKVLLKVLDNFTMEDAINCMQVGHAHLGVITCILPSSCCGAGPCLGGLMVHHQAAADSALTIRFVAGCRRHTLTEWRALWPAPKRMLSGTARGCASTG